MFWEMLIGYVISFALGAAATIIVAFFLSLKKDLKIKINDGMKSSNTVALEEISERIKDLKAGIDIEKKTKKK